MELRQYEIILVNLDPTVGSEIKKTRPYVIISPNEMNIHLNTLVVAPMTSKTRNYPTRVNVYHQNQDGQLIIDQIRTIDKSRIIKVLGALSNNEIKLTKAVIKETFLD